MKPAEFLVNWLHCKSKNCWKNPVNLCDWFLCKNVAVWKNAKSFCTQILLQACGICSEKCCKTKVQKGASEHCTLCINKIAASLKTLCKRTVAWKFKLKQGHGCTNDRLILPHPKLLSDIQKCGGSGTVEVRRTDCQRTLFVLHSVCCFVAGEALVWLAVSWSCLMWAKEAHVS